MEALALLLVVILWFLHSRKITELNKRIAACLQDKRGFIVIRTPILALLLTLSTHANAALYILKHDQWELMTADQKHGYVAGVVDTMHYAMFQLANTSGEVTEEQSVFSECLRKNFGETTAYIIAIDQEYAKYTSEEIEWVSPTQMLMNAIMAKCHASFLK